MTLGSLQASFYTNTLGGFFKGQYSSFNVEGATVKAVGIDVADVDSDGVSTTTENLTLDGAKSIFYISHRPIHRFRQVNLNGGILPAVDPVSSAINYSYNIPNGWVSFRNVYSATNTLSVVYDYSTDLDIVTANGDNQVAQQTSVFLNNGNFSFTPHFLTGAPLNQSRQIAAADIDGDGDIDFAIANRGDASKVLITTAYGSAVTSISLPGGNLESNDVAWGDVDGDGLLDLAVANGSGNPSKIYRNNGGGSFTEIWSHASPDAQSVRFADVDRDGDLDLVVADYNGQVNVYRNDLDKKYIYTSNIDSPQGIQKRDPVTMAVVAGITSYNGNTIKEVWSMAVDQQYLYFVTNAGSYQAVKLNKNDLSYVASFGVYGVPGAGNTNLSSAYGIDVDSNYVYVADSSNSRIVRLNKDMTFHDSFGGATVYGSNVLAIPKNIKVDSNYIYIVDNNTNRIIKLTNTAVPAFVSEQGTTGSGPNQYKYIKGLAIDSNYIYVNDVQNYRIKKLDKNLNEIAVIGSWGTGNDNFNSNYELTQDSTYLYISDYSNRRIQKRLKSDLSFVQAFDIGIVGATNSVEFDNSNNGFSRQFTGPVWTSPSADLTTSIEMCDFDNDGDLDILVVNKGSKPFFYRNTTAPGSSTPTFIKSNQFSMSLNAEGASVADVNGDGYLDVVTTNESDKSHIHYFQNYHNNDDYEFKWGSESEDDHGYNNFKGSKSVMADFNNDGLMDLAVTAEETTTLSGENSGILVYKNPPPVKVVKVKSSVNGAGGKRSVTVYYSVNTDGTLGQPIASESR